MNKEIKLDIIGFMCLMIGILISLFIDILFWIGLGLIIIAFGLFMYSIHVGSVRFRNEIKKIDRESNAKLITEIFKIWKETKE